MGISDIIVSDLGVRNDMNSALFWSDADVLTEVANNAATIISQWLMHDQEIIRPCKDAILRLFDTNSMDAKRIIELWKEKKALSEEYWSHSVAEKEDEEDNDLRIENNYDELVQQCEIHERIQRIQREISQILSWKASLDPANGLPSIDEILSLDITTTPDRKYMLWIMWSISEQGLQKMVEDDIRVGKKKPDPTKYLLWASELLGQKQYDREQMKAMYKKYLSKPETIVTLDGEQIENMSAHQIFVDKMSEVNDILRKNIVRDLFPYMTDFYKEHIAKELSKRAPYN